jgi:hypothetical protein
MWVPLLLRLFRMFWSGKWTIGPGDGPDFGLFHLGNRLTSIWADAARPFPAVFNVLTGGPATGESSVAKYNIL